MRHISPSISIQKSVQADSFDIICRLPGCAQAALLRTHRWQQCAPAAAATTHHMAAQQTWELYCSHPSRSAAFGNTQGSHPTMDKRSITASAFSGQDRDDAPEPFGPSGESMHRPFKALSQARLNAGQHRVCGIQICQKGHSPMYAPHGGWPMHMDRPFCPCEQVMLVVEQRALDCKSVW